MGSVNHVKTARLLAVLLLAAAGVAAGVLPYPSADIARASEVTASANNLRDGWDQAETTGAMSPATLLGGSFGELFDTPVDGQVYAQPVVADNTAIGNAIIVATENDYVYSLNAATGAVNWQVSLGTPWPSSAENCTDLAPNVGVTGTPVYDPATGTVYMVSQVVPPGHTDEQPVFYLDALNAATGAEQPGWPVQIKGAPTNDPRVPFDSFTELQRPGLLLTDGGVYAGFGSHCDFTPYEGYVVGVNTTTRALTMWSDEAGTADKQAGIWQSGGGLLSDGNGQIIFASGNGVSPAPGPGKKPPSELAESVVRLAVQSDGSLVAKDFFSPANAPYLDSIDGDLGSGGPVELPFGTTAVPKLLLEAGKVDGLFVLNPANLGGREQGPNKSDAAVSEITKGLPGQWGHPATFADTPVLSTANVAASNDYVYYVGKSDVMRYLKVGLGGSGGVTPVLTSVGQSSDTFGYTSGSPVVTSNGTDPTSAVVWAVQSSDEFGATGSLQAFPGVPGGSCSATKPCTVSPLWSFPITSAGKFTIPATDNGRVYIGTRGPSTTTSTVCGGVSVPAGTRCGQVYGFGSPAKAPLTGGSPVLFGPAAVGGTPSQATAMITNTSASPVTINSVTTSSSNTTNPFTVSGPYLDNGTAIGSFPYALPAGDTLTARGVTFTPAGPGSYNGSVQFKLAGLANFPVASVSLSGTGTQPGFYASAPAVNFGSVPVGTTGSAQLTVTNGDASAETLTAPAPGSPYTVSGLPPNTQSIPPNTSLSLTITYSPTAVQADNGSLSLQGGAGDAGPPTMVSLTGSGVADISPTLTGTASLDFGSVPLGHQAQRMITLTNTGNLPAVITATSSLPLPYGTPSPVPAGLPVTPGGQYQVNVPVTFSPTGAGVVDTTYQVTWTDAAGTHNLKVPLTGTGVSPKSGFAVPPPGGGWSFNGTSYMTGTTLSLNYLAQNQVGAAVYSSPVASNGLSVRFTANLTGGTGAAGMTFSLLDASSVSSSAVGGDGPELGFGGLPGVAVTLDTSKDAASYPSGNFVGIATGAKNGALTFAATTTKVPALRKGTHVIGVTVSGGLVTVTVDGKQVLAKTVAVPKLALIGFTAGTGSRTDHHFVTKIAIKSGSRSIPPPGGGWSYNGKAGVLNSDTLLTRAVVNQAGTVIYPTPVQSNGLSVTFNASLSGGTGGDGLTFGLLDPAKSSATTVGGTGTMLGLGSKAGVPGMGIALGTDGQAGPSGPPADFVGITRIIENGTLRFQVNAYGVGSLATGTHTVTITVTRSGTVPVVTVWLDGVQVIQQDEPTLTPTVRLAFTAGTGATQTNMQLVRDVAISATR
jgi:hypothetical protein